MDPKLKKVLRGISLEIRRLLEGRYDEHGRWQGGDLERRLNELGVWRDRNAKPVEELPQLSAEDKAARRLVDGYLKLREAAGVGRETAVPEFLRESAYTWANRLFALRCMEARGIIDEVILQKDSYGGRSLAHFRFARQNPEACAGPDDGLFAVLFAEFTERAKELPLVFDPKSPAVALRPSIAALKRTIAWLGGRETARGLDAAADEVFVAPDAFGWAYQYYQDDEKKRVDEWLKTRKGFKCEGADIIPKTALYTESYMVKFLVQNSLGALWMGMYPDSGLCEQWEYYVKDADRTPVIRKPVRDITFLDPAQGSGHFHLEAFDVFYAMHAEEAGREGRILSPREICAAILNRNLYGIDIDGRAVQIGTAALWMKAKERAPDLEAADLTSFHEHLVATNIRLPKEGNHLEIFLQKHPEDAPLRPSLEAVFQGLEHADELGALLQIEEPVEAVLRRLKAEADRSQGTMVQTGLFEPTLVQGRLPIHVEDYDSWKQDALNRLRAHLEAEAQAADPAQAYFVDSAAKGLAFFDLLSRRYDVVGANPPYMGSENMGDELKAYVQRFYGPGKRDLYAAFILRCVEFTKHDGRSVVVTQQSWLFNSYYRALRNSETESSGLLCKTHIEIMAHLGPNAFTEISGEVVSVALTVFRNHCPNENAVCEFYRLTDIETPAKKLLALATSVRTKGARRYQIHQSRIRAIPDSAVVYWLSATLLESLASGCKLLDVAAPCRGCDSCDTNRFVRFFWETTLGNRWAWYARGGPFTRWVGLQSCRIEFDFDFQRLRATGKAIIPSRDRYFKEGFTYTDFACGNMAARVLGPEEVFSDAAPGVFLNNAGGYALLAILNSRVFTKFIRVLSPSPLHFRTGYIAKVPVPASTNRGLILLQNLCVRLKTMLIAKHQTERLFEYPGFGKYPADILSDVAVAASLSAVEGLLERLVFDAYGLDTASIASVLAETGLPPGWHAALPGYDSLLGLGAGLPALPTEVSGFQAHTDGSSLTSDKLAEVKNRLRLLYESGPSGCVGGDESDSVEDEIDEEDEMQPVGTSLPIPAETFLEELSQGLCVHPVSIYWLLKEGIECDGWRCPSEERRRAEDRFSVLVLRLLRHRWPKQLDATEPLPGWADRDGVIPLSIGCGKVPLIKLIRERLDQDFPGGNSAALELEFEQIVGIALERWLAGPFFERHITQFRKRPIAWQIETQGWRKKEEGSKKAKIFHPVFACLIYYHKLDEDLLPKIRTGYTGPLRAGFETELRTLERLAGPTAVQQGRKLELDQWIEELKEFDVKLEVVSITGFGPEAVRPALRQFAINDALLSLTARWLTRLEGGVRTGDEGRSVTTDCTDYHRSESGPEAVGEGGKEVSAAGPLAAWQSDAATTGLHPGLAVWMEEAFSRLDFFCVAVGPKAAGQETFVSEPSSKELAALVCVKAAETVGQVLNLACERWWKKFEETVLVPLKDLLKQAREEQERVKAELGLEEVKPDHARQTELADRKDELKQRIKSLREEMEEKTAEAKRLRLQIEAWTCPEAETWEDWLGAQPLFDAIASLDGKRPAPATIAEFIAQESAYAPDLNDGVRVNIAPIQKAGLLHADVLDAKDVEKAISDRAEWRSDERRWVREGKLPQPGWWETTTGTA